MGCSLHLVRYMASIELDEEVLTEILRTAYIADDVFVDFVFLAECLEDSATSVLAAILIMESDYLDLIILSIALWAMGDKGNFSLA